MFKVNMKSLVFCYGTHQTQNVHGQSSHLILNISYLTVLKILSQKAKVV